MRTLLSGERTALNYLQHMSGVATYTRQMVDILAEAGSKARLVDTRKTTPGMRIFDKMAVRIGGGGNHRHNLSDAVLLKDNHIDAAGGVREAVAAAKARCSFMAKVEVECENLDMVRDAVEAGADVIECNFSCPNMEEHGTGSDVGQDPETVRRYTAATRRGTNLPILAKMTPNITDMTVPAVQAKLGGADGIAAINTIKSITGVNIDTLVAFPSVHGHSMIGGYSGRAVKPIALRFIADLGRCEALKGLHISGMGGIVTWRDAVEFLLLGAGSL